MLNIPRVALFADTFHEINGAANIIRRLTDYSKENNFPFLCIRTGKETKFIEDGNLRILELKRSPLSFPLDGELKYDPFLWRFKKLVAEKLDEFRPDVLHVTGLNDVSQLGFYFTHFKSIPSVASWHTNAHEYAARRLLCVLRWLPAEWQKRLGIFVERTVMSGLMKLYGLAQVQLAPNQELVEQIQKMTRRPAFLMSRGVDTKFLNSDKRKRTDAKFILGYVGRLRPEKNVRFLARVEDVLKTAGLKDYGFVLVGEGSEDVWLKKNVSTARFTGVLRGEQLAQAFADMDLFVFPSRTDAFGNVVLEAMAAGVPPVVFPEGGPKFLIERGINGFVARDETDFLETVKGLAKYPDHLIEVKRAARTRACQYSWERVFETVYDNYRNAVKFGKDVRV